MIDDDQPKKSSNFQLPKIKLQTHLGQTKSNERIFGSQLLTKRLRTTISPDQLQFLFECYQTESNPSRKMLEEISKQVNLKKRVVQVWYQNSRARERKGHFRLNSSGFLNTFKMADETTITPKQSKSKFYTEYNYEKQCMEEVSAIIAGKKAIFMCK